MGKSFSLHSQYADDLILGWWLLDGGIENQRQSKLLRLFNRLSMLN